MALYVNSEAFSATRFKLHSWLELTKPFWLAPPLLHWHWFFSRQRQWRSLASHIAPRHNQNARKSSSGLSSSRLGSRP
eukprot:10999607-Karenia_brevis.AAC.1